jgi:transposase
MSVDWKHLNTQQAALGQQAQNIELLKLVQAKQEALNIAGGMPKPRHKERDSDDVHFGKLRIEALEREKEAAYQALREAQEITKEWQSAMEAWRDLAQTLRDEVKACPNHEAHKFGKDDQARANRKVIFENNRRVELGLKPHKT